MRGLLLILDGYGLAPISNGNAVELADTPCLDELLKIPSCAALDASGEAVGLPEGFIGNSEVGHLNIGAGRVVLQDMKRVDRDIETGDFYDNPGLKDLCAKVKKTGGRLHLMGLLSNGGVHSHINHIKALVRLCAQEGIPVRIHAFMDGRDTLPAGGEKFVADILRSLQRPSSCLATLCGRFYAMDRDGRWDRVQKAWNLLCKGEGHAEPDAVQALKQSYRLGVTDEFIEPVILLEKDQACVKSGDGVFFFNFRADRARELAHAFCDADFGFFERGSVPRLAGIATMTKYDDELKIPVAFQKESINMTLGEYLAQAGKKQLRIAETEKYAHVTYFFNGGREVPFDNEARILVPSPKDVPTYDLKPEMSAEAVTDKLIESIRSDAFDFIVCNFANPDMVGHTGVLEAAVKAIETVNACIERIWRTVRSKEGFVIAITADHGNAEEMLTRDGQPQTAHSLNPTPFVVYKNGMPLSLIREGKLSDIAPTLLNAMEMSVPPEMTGRCLLRHNEVVHE